MLVQLISAIRIKNSKFIEFAIAYCPIIENLESDYFRQVLVHEAIGHGLGKLEDEYAYSDKGSISTLEVQRIRVMQANGWAQKCGFYRIGRQRDVGFFFDRFPLSERASGSV